MIKVKYREHADDSFETVAYLDGISTKVVEGCLVVLELEGFESVLLPSGVFDLQPVHRWVEVKGGWAPETDDREVGVYTLEEAAT